MAVDRSAVSKNAQSLASRGQFDAAIAEWQKLFTKTPADAPIFNTIGDLLIKKKSPAEAIGAYCKAAEIFRSDKELLKAIAAYKKILKIDPNCAEIYRYLGDLNAERGLVSSAVTDYSTLADLYVKEGKAPEALEVYQTILRLDPSNAQVQKRVDALSAPTQASAAPSPSTPAAAMPEGRPTANQQPEPVPPAGTDQLEPTLKLSGAAKPGAADKAPAGVKPGAAAEPEATLKLSGAAKPGAADKAPAGVKPGAAAEPEATLKLSGAAKPGAADKAPVGVKPGAVAKPGGKVTPAATSGPEGLLSEALDQINKGEFDSADTILSQLLNQDPGNPQVCQLFARLHLKRGELSMALNEYEFLAGAAMRADDFNLAESLIQEYLAVQSACAPLLEMLGRVYEKRENPATAALHYKQAILVLLDHPDPDLPTLPAELYDTIKELVPTSPLVSELASLMEAKSVVAEPSSVEPEQPREDPSPEAKPPALWPPEVSEETPVPEEVGSSQPTMEVEPPVPEPAPEAEQPVLAFSKTADTETPPEPTEVQSEPATPVPAAAAGSDGGTNQDQSEVHFTLGQAYKDMGLFAEAIEEFRHSLTASHLFLDSSLELAACLKDQGMIRRAIASLESAIGDPRCQGEKSVEIRYELGLLLEAEGLFERALGAFETIPAFKDVAKRLEWIKGGGQEDVAPSPASAATAGAHSSTKSSTKKPKKRRISYL